MSLPPDLPLDLDAAERATSDTAAYTGASVFAPVTSSSEHGSGSQQQPLASTSWLDLGQPPLHMPPPLPSSDPQSNLTSFAMPLAFDESLQLPLEHEAIGSISNSSVSTAVIQEQHSHDTSLAPISEQQADVTTSASWPSVHARASSREPLQFAPSHPQSPSHPDAFSDGSMSSVSSSLSDSSMSSTPTAAHPAVGSSGPDVPPGQHESNITHLQQMLAHSRAEMERLRARMHAEQAQAMRRQAALAHQQQQQQHVQLQQLQLNNQFMPDNNFQMQMQQQQLMPTYGLPPGVVDDFMLPRRPFPPPMVPSVPAIHVNSLMPGGTLGGAMAPPSTPSTATPSQVDLYTMLASYPQGAGMAPRSVSAASTSDTSPMGLSSLHLTTTPPGPMPFIDPSAVYITSASVTPEQQGSASPGGADRSMYAGRRMACVACHGVKIACEDVRPCFRCVRMGRPCIQRHKAVSKSGRGRKAGRGAGAAAASSHSASPTSGDKDSPSPPASSGSSAYVRRSHSRQASRDFVLPAPYQMSRVHSETAAQSLAQQGHMHTRF